MAKQIWQVIKSRFEEDNCKKKPCKLKQILWSSVLDIMYRESYTLKIYPNFFFRLSQSSKYHSLL